MKMKTGHKVAFAIVILLLLAIILCVALVKKYTPSKERVDYTELTPLGKDEAQLLFWQEVDESRGRKFEDTWYLPMRTVTEKINRLFYFDEKEQTLSLPGVTEVIRAYTDEKAYYRNKTKQVLLYAPVRVYEGEVYLAIPFVAEFSDLEYEYFASPDRLVLRTGANQSVCFRIEKGTPLREAPDIKSRIIRDLKKQEQLIYIDAGAEETKSFSKAMTADGVFGYVKKKDISSTFFSNDETSYTQPEYTHISFEDTVVLGWHQVTNQKANASLQGLIEGNDKLTVVSPTWFRIVDNEGNISSLAEEEYVRTAKANGLQVWALVDNFANEVDSFEVLSRTTSRDRLTNALIAEAIRFDLDGINIDFEMLSLATGPHFIEFLRELSVKCRANGLVLSVDNYVPSAHAAYYDLKSQGEVVDFVVIMAYDEHYAGSETAGSVASYGFLQQATDAIVTMVKKEQVLMAVPFYTRLWMETEENGNVKLTSEAVGMQTAEAELRRNDVTPEWNSAARQYYASYKKDDSTYRIWLEEEDSLREKLLCIKDAELAGVAVWRLGFEKSEVWELFDLDVLAPVSHDVVEEDATP